MHDLPDTDDMDASAERFWPEGYKQFIRNGLSRSFSGMVLDTAAFKTIYESSYQDRYATYEVFVARLAEMVVIGAENGVDCILEEVYDAFKQNSPLPATRCYARYFWPEAFGEALVKELSEKVFEEFDNHHAYVHIYEDHYESNLSFTEFISQITQLVLTGAVNGADDALGNIYCAFTDRSPLPVARRRPRALR
jgi:hypothetical protein